MDGQRLEVERPGRQQAARVGGQQAQVAEGDGFAGLRALNLIGTNYVAPDMTEYFARVLYRRDRLKHHCPA